MLPVINRTINVNRNIVGKTYKIDFKNNRISENIDGIESLEQAINIILNVDRYSCLIYDWNFGSELLDLVGKNIEYVKTESKRLIKEALLQDDRIQDVSNFTFEQEKDNLLVSFLVSSIYGNIHKKVEVKV
jgi:phage baseplate assembly protein W